MDCVELQNSLVETADASRAEQRAHLKTCPACTALVAELNLIAHSASLLQAAEEPSPRVWNSIESALRREGLIHPPRAESRRVPSFASRWGHARWLVPVAAIFLVVLGISIRPRPQMPVQSAVISPQRVALGSSAQALAGLNDEDLLQEVSDTAPVMKAEWENDLRNANAYIRDAQAMVDQNPNDEDARRALLDAYEQKSLLFEMAMDRSLP
ncbi:MAG TPA: anti-sigma factor [Candidatus Aquilonibacter sp.]|nr:anti-sigma factor [Candidatus Aquilonibacter sp.]